MKKKTRLPNRTENTKIGAFRQPALTLPILVVIIIIIIIIINILTAIGLAPGGSSPVHIYREHYTEYTNNTQNT